MIVLTEQEKDWFLGFIDEFREGMLARGLVVQPIEFKNGWMLPERVLDDPRCAAAKAKLIDIGEYKNITFREVTQDELITEKIIL